MHHYLLLAACLGTGSPAYDPYYDKEPPLKKSAWSCGHSKRYRPKRGAERKPGALARAEAKRERKRARA